MELQLNGLLIKDVDLLIFDKDGTLTDLYTYWSWIAKERAKYICHHLNLGANYIDELQDVMGLDLMAKKFRPEGPIGVKKRSEVLSAVVSFLESQGQKDPRVICEKAFAETDVLAQQNLPTIVKLIPGVTDFFSKIKGRCKTAIATADNTERALLIMGFLNLPNFDLVVGGDQIAKSKPDPEIVKKILLQLGVDPSRTVIVGDSHNDVFCGKNAGIKAQIAVCTGLDTREELLKTTPYVVNRLSEIEVH
jgi:HAD superfamily hydrolase (TIGR01549 family)